MRRIAVTILLLMLLASPGWTGPAASVQMGSVNVELRLDKGRYRTGEAVGITLRLTNQGHSRATFQFNDGRMYDFAVVKGGQVVWQWSRGRAFVQVLTSLSLEPGEVRIFRERWDQRDADGASVGAGDYEMIALFPASGADLGRPGARGLRVSFAIYGGAQSP